MAIENQVFNGPIPGQSLTQDPTSRGPWEMPPQMNTANQAIDHLFNTVTSPKFIAAYDELLREDKRFYVDELVVGMLSEGFLNGLWTVDMMVLLVEPLTVLMVWSAAQLDKSPSFSGDTGVEDRTGFEELTEIMLEDAPEIVPEEPTEVPEEPTIPVEENPAATAPQSPLVTGA